MVRTEYSREFESALLSYAGMCHAVALRLCKDREIARQLAEETLLRAWSERESLDLRGGLKMGLLSMLRANYLRRCTGFAATQSESRSQEQPQLDDLRHAPSFASTTNHISSN